MVVLQTSRDVEPESVGIDDADTKTYTSWLWQDRSAKAIFIANIDFCVQCLLLVNCELKHISYMTAFESVDRMLQLFGPTIWSQSKYSDRLLTIGDDQKKGQVRTQDIRYR